MSKEDALEVIFYFTVCGMIILVGTAILGRVLLSRKLRMGDDQHPVHHHPEACLHACSSKVSAIELFF